VLFFEFNTISRLYKIMRKLHKDKYIERLNVKRNITNVRLPDNARGLLKRHTGM